MTENIAELEALKALYSVTVYQSEYSVEEKIEAETRAHDLIEQAANLNEGNEYRLRLVLGDTVLKEFVLPTKVNNAKDWEYLGSVFDSYLPEPDEDDEWD